MIWISFPSQFDSFVVNTGSICIDGVSLTSAKTDNNKFMVAVIPHTLNVTTLGKLQKGDAVNLEFDIFGKYVNKILTKNHSKENKSASIYQQFLSQPFD